MGRARVGVLISGRGSNLQALLDAAAEPGYPAEIALVVSNRPGAAGLDRAARAGVPATTIDHKGFADRRTFEQAIDSALRAAECEIICLAGFMRVLSAEFVDGWTDRILNIHPSLLPAFKGLDVQQRALDAGVKIAGCSVHLVTPDLDDGPIIAQAAVPVLADDDAQSLSARILEQEHRIYPAALAWLASGRVRIDAGNATILDSVGSGALVSPSIEPT